MSSRVAPGNSIVYPPYATVYASATVSEDGLYRYSLTRRWKGPMRDQVGLRALTYVMLNPSTADASVDDPTIRRCVTFARREGYDRIQIVNLFAFRATDPDVMHAAPDPVGPRNDQVLDGVFAMAVADEEVVVAAWGAKAPGWRVEAVMKLADAHGVRWSSFGVTSKGIPRHPLFLPAITPLEPWDYR